MRFKVETISPFRKSAKKLIKKYPSLKKELSTLGELLSKNPQSGTALGRDCYKVRLAIRSKGKGKSGGARIITHVYFSGETVYLLYIYDKSETETISERQIAALLELIE